LEGGADVLYDPKVHQKVVEAVLRSVSRSARAELIEEDEDFAAAVKRWKAAKDPAA